MVWRALAILAEAGTTVERRSPGASPEVRQRRHPRLDLASGRDRARAAGPASEPQGGTHASPRWHVRRGHWRQLADGRRVFVRACEVGDPERGGVIKDYIIEGRAA